MKTCTNCQSTNYVKAGFKIIKNNTWQKYKCKECNRQFTGEEKFHHLSENNIQLLKIMHQQNIPQREIARRLNLNLRAVQYHLES
jgi:transposase-like protein